MLDIPTEYCEQLSHASVEPINAVTNIAFLFFALLAFYKLRDEKGILKFILPLLLVLIGIGSAWWHTGHSVGGDIADSLSILVFASVTSILLLRKLFASKAKVALVFISLFGTALIAEHIPYLNGSLPYIVLLLGLASAGMFYIRKFPASKNLVVASLLTFGLAIIFRSLDMALCSQLPIGTHFLWHVLVALLGYELILLVTRKPKTPVDI